MKRMHVNLSVADLDKSISFYSMLFAAGPTVVKGDYAKWMLEDPRVNFSITTRGSRNGIDHLGIEAEDDGELRDVYARLKNAGRPVIEEGQTTCCYAHSDKNWIRDPEGVSWEAFLTTGESETFGDESATTSAKAASPQATGCCPKPETPEAKAGGACCDPATKAAVRQSTGCCA